MAIVKLVLKAVGALLLLGITGIFVLAYAGMSEERYSCSGKIEGAGETHQAQVFLKMQLYRPWLVWADSKGAAWSEIPNEELEYYPELQKNGDFIHMSSYDSKHFGSFSTLSHAIQLGTRNGTFLGMCKPIPAAA